MNTVPYTNARRAGRTNPDKIEMIAADDSRRKGPRYVLNRADLRAAKIGVKSAAKVRLKARKPRANAKAVAA